MYGDEPEVPLPEDLKRGKKMISMFIAFVQAILAQEEPCPKCGASMAAPSEVNPRIWLCRRCGTMAFHLWPRRFTKHPKNPERKIFE